LTRGGSSLTRGDVRAWFLLAGGGVRLAANGACREGTIPRLEGPDGVLTGRPLSASCAALESCRALSWRVAARGERGRGGSGQGDLWRGEAWLARAGDAERRWSSNARCNLN
jgi:hypothetical protein